MRPSPRRIHPRPGFASKQPSPLRQSSSLSASPSPLRQAGLPALWALIALVALTGCPRSRTRTTPGPEGLRVLRLSFAKGQATTYEASLVFQARMDRLGTSQSSKHVFVARFDLTRTVTLADANRTCFEDRFSNASVRIDKLPPRLTQSVAAEFDQARVLWCLDRSGRMSMFSVTHLGRALTGLKLSSVLSRIYHLAASASADKKRLGDEWKQTTSTAQVIGTSKVRTDIETAFSVMASDNCRPSPLASADSKTGKGHKTADSRPRPPARPKGSCLEVLVTEKGIMPDFDMTSGKQSFKMGGVIKGKASIVLDTKTGTWRAWAVRRVVGIAATTRVKGASADFGMRTDVRFDLTRKAQ